MTRMEYFTTIWLLTLTAIAHIAIIAFDPERNDE